MTLHRNLIRRGASVRSPMLTLALTFIAGAFAGFAACTWITGAAFSRLVPSGAQADFGLMAEAWNTIDEYYVDRSAVQPRAMTYGAISGMVFALGDTDHSTFLSPSMLRVTRQVESGKLQGVGLEVHIKDGHVVVVTPLDHSPAARAGVRPGDIILGVDGKSVAGLPLSEVVGKIAGPSGTHVTLHLLTPDTGRARVVSLTRTTLSVPNVTWQRLPRTELADVRVAQFSHGVNRQLKAALKQIAQDHLHGIVLDLRDDPGGLLDEAIDVASQFIPRGNVLLVKDAKGKITHVPVKPPASAPDIPLVVLIDRGTASGAEVVAGALKDSGRAPLVGETTFGTGTVLSEFRLSDGSALLLAVDEWLTPNGHTFWHKGIQPDVDVSLPSATTPLWPEAERTLTPEQLMASKDTQLLKAVEVLRQRAHKRVAVPPM